MSEKITLHIGLHKTGTSFLQHNLFIKYPELCLIRGWYSHRHFFAMDLHEKHIFISDEEMSGGLYRGTYLDDFFINIEKIKRLYGDPRIILGIRNQSSFLLSVYKQYLHNGGSQKIDYLYNLEDTGLIKHHELVLSGRITKLKENFTDVFIYSQERLKEDPQGFIDYFQTFMNCETRLSVKDVELSNSGSNIGVRSTTQVNLLRKMNGFNDLIKKVKFLPHLYTRPFRALHITPRNITQDWLKHMGKTKFEFSDELKKHLTDYYKEDWENAKQHVSF